MLYNLKEVYINNFSWCVFINYTNYLKATEFQNSYVLFTGIEAGGAITIGLDMNLKILSSNATVSNALYDLMQPSQTLMAF